MVFLEIDAVRLMQEDREHAAFLNETGPIIRHVSDEFCKDGVFSSVRFG